jgi:hypothetical protein
LHPCVINWSGDGPIKDVQIIDSVLGSIVSHVTLGPLETKHFTRRAVITRDICNRARVSVKTSENTIAIAQSNQVCVRVKRPCEVNNFENVKIGDQTAVSFGSGGANNNIKIITNKG